MIGRGNVGICESKSMQRNGSEWSQSVDEMPPSGTTPDVPQLAVQRSPRMSAFQTRDRQQWVDLGRSLIPKAFRRRKVTK